MNLKNNFIFIVFALLLIYSQLEAKRQRGEYATRNLKGQSYYLNNCSSCHGGGNRGGNIASIREWEEIFSKNAKELIALHNDEENSSVLEYIKSNKFKNERKKLLEFLQEFAYDSENIPTCN